MRYIDDIAELDALYGPPSTAAVRKVADRLTPAYRSWIAEARFCVLATVGPSGTDASPRGDDGAVVRELDPKTLAMPDWSGNNRLDSLRNIVSDGRVSLMFMVSGARTVVRVNGTARLTADDALRTTFARNGRMPTTVIVIAISEVYVQCPKALIRSDLWNRDDSSGLPTLGEIIAEATEGEEGGRDYDEAYPARARKTLW